MRVLLVEIQCQDFSIVSCSSKSISINSTMLKCISYNNLPIFIYLLALRTDISFLSIQFNRAAYGTYGRIAYNRIAYGRIATVAL